ncbi:MAG TPA: redoxin domain-containing protein [Nannocystis exedens]|nr:redoxin domain-containing protein [Nannocystis exedens]
MNKRMNKRMNRRMNKSWSPTDRVGFEACQAAAKPEACARRWAYAGAIMLSTLTGTGCPAKPQEPPLPPPTTAVPSDPDLSAALPDPERQPTNRETGEVLALTIPRIGGDSLDLRDLRGKVVIIELSATWAPNWWMHYGFYNDLLGKHGPDQLAIILVAMDSQREAISLEPELRRPGFELSWDPQGALAAQLQAAAVPTVLILDRAGRIALIEAAQMSPQQISDALAPMLAQP